MFLSLFIHNTTFAKESDENLKESIFQSFIQEESLKESIIQSKKEIEETKYKRELVFEEIGKILTFYQAHGDYFWLEVFFGSNSLSDLINRMYLLKAMAEYQTEMFQRLNEHEVKVLALQNIISYKEDYIYNLQIELLKKIKSYDLDEQALREEFLNLSNEEKNRIVQKHQSYWEKDGTKKFNDLYKKFVKTVNNLSTEQIDSMIKREGFFEFSATITEKDINNLMHQSKELKDLTFSFENEQLILTGKTEDTSIFAIGHFKRKNANELTFIFDDFLINGLSISEKELEKFSDSSKFTFIPSRFKKGIKISDFSIDETKMTFYFSL